MVAPGFTSDYLADDMAPMARSRSVFIYDQRGIGKSTLVSDSTGLAAQRYVEDLEAIRKHLGLEQLTLLGHSWGAAPAALYAMQYPHRVRRMIPRWDDPVTAQRAGRRVPEAGCEPRQRQRSVA
jgi:proline iminopeptidase